MNEPPSSPNVKQETKATKNQKDRNRRKRKASEKGALIHVAFPRQNHPAYLAQGVPPKTHEDDGTTCEEEMTLIIWDINGLEAWVPTKYIQREQNNAGRRPRSNRLTPQEAEALAEKRIKVEVGVVKPEEAGDKDSKPQSKSHRPKSASAAPSNKAKWLSVSATEVPRKKKRQLVPETASNHLQGGKKSKKSVGAKMGTNPMLSARKSPPVVLEARPSSPARAPQEIASAQPARGTKKTVGANTMDFDDSDSDDEFWKLKEVPTKLAARKVAPSTGTKSTTSPIKTHDNETTRTVPLFQPQNYEDTDDRSLQSIGPGDHKLVARKSPRSVSEKGSRVSKAQSMAPIQPTNLWITSEANSALRRGIDPEVKRAAQTTKKDLTFGKELQPSKEAGTPQKCQAKTSLAEVDNVIDLLDDDSEDDCHTTCAPEPEFLDRKPAAKSSLQVDKDVIDISSDDSSDHDSLKHRRFSNKLKTLVPLKAKEAKDIAVAPELAVEDSSKRGRKASAVTRGAVEHACERGLSAPAIWAKGAMAPPQLADSDSFSLNSVHLPGKLPSKITVEEQVAKPRIVQKMDHTRWLPHPEFVYYEEEPDPAMHFGDDDDDEWSKSDNDDESLESL